MIIEKTSVPKDLNLVKLDLFTFPNWYEKFEKISIKSEIIQIPIEVINYLLDDIIILPKECYPNEKDEDYQFSDETPVDFENPFPTGTCIDDHEDNDENDQISNVIPEFPQFSASITEKIAKLNGFAFIKTNWHAPKDAYWITAGQTLRVRDIIDVYQLLKASSIVKSDLALQKENSEQFYLILKEWQDIHPASEFRCFVKNHNLIAISPRDWPNYHSHMTTHSRDIVGDIVSLFREKIKNVFPVNNYVFDVIRHSKDEVYLVDFSPFNEKFTDGLAYEWDYLNGMINDIEHEDDPEFRFLTADCGIQPSKRNNYGVPQDIINMFKTSGCSTTANNNFTDLLASRAEEEIRTGN